MKDLTEEILDHVLDVLRKKDHDYNGAFDKACDRLGNTYAVGKVYEKTERIITLSMDKAQVNEEGLEDALLDNIGYCTRWLNRIWNGRDSRNKIGYVTDYPEKK